VFVRHAESAAAHPGVPFPVIEGGHADPPLHPDGERQAEAVGARLAAEAVTGLYVTPLVRTHQTAAPLAARLGLEPVVIPELREVHMGEWEGGEFRIRFARHDPLALRVLREQRWDLIPGAEPMAAMRARVRAGLRRVLDATAPGTTAVVVGHGAVIAELLHQATGSEPFAFVQIANGSISRLVVRPSGRQVLQSFNETAHL